MPEKLQSEIIKIALDSAAFKGTGTAITPTYINYFFGNNGTGKTTIAKAIKTGDGVFYAPGKKKEDFLPLVFDQDFINDNMTRYHDMDGVFTFDEENREIQKEIDEKTAERMTAEYNLKTINAEIEKREKDKNNLRTEMYETCWAETKDIRSMFSKTQRGTKNSKKLFNEEVKRFAPVRHDLRTVKRMYDTAYSDSAKKYEWFHTIKDVSVLDSLQGSEILGTAIVNTSNTPFAEFLREVGSMEWVRRGHAAYHEKAGGKCPYCSGTLPPDFEKMLSASFDAQYQTNLDKLNKFLDTYRAAANSLFMPLEKLPREICPEIDVRPYNERLSVVRAVITANIAKIREKINEPSKIITLNNVSAPLQNLSDIIEKFNQAIAEHNSIVDAGAQIKTECRNAVFEHMAYLLKDILIDYDKKETILEREITKLQDIGKTQKGILDTLQMELNGLRRQTVGTETAMDNINIMLRESGFQGFELRPHEENDQTSAEDGTAVSYPKSNYEVVRTDTGEIAENLSEGEKNFIAFLYFQQKVFGRDSADADTRGKIVVIDDPVSGMDSRTLFAVGAQVRKMIEICRKNADSRNPAVPGNSIKQIFILTHNTYFYREITYAYADCYDFVSFYLVRKRENKSSVQLCRRRDPARPAEWMNVNPVKNSYAALWEEYREASSGIPLMSVARRILEYYFLQLCGFKGSDLRKCILEDNKYAFTHDDNGNEDYTKFDMASSMLSYISAGSNGVNEDLNYVDDCSDIQLCRDTFHMIFHYMNQDQHYNMMMGSE